MSTGEGRMNRVAGCLALVLIGGMLAHAGRAASRESMGRDVEDADDRRAWREFVAVNWPADARERRADRAASLGADAPSTWETWQNVKDIFLLGGKDPGPWLARAPALSTTNAAARFDTGSFAAAVPAKHVVAGVMVPFDPIETATHVNETRLNRAAFEYVRANDLYNIDGQVARFHTGLSPDFPAASVEVKAQWRPITAGQRARFHTLSVSLDDGSRRLYGLTALHIASKRTGQWFWATFEHVDNVGAADCRAAPRDMSLEGTVWANYRLRGTMSRSVGQDGQPILLANSHLEAGVEHSASCVTCHSRASIGIVDGKVSRLGVLNTSAAPLGGDSSRGYVGEPERGWFVEGTRQVYLPLDFVWSLAKAQPRSSR